MSTEAKIISPKTVKKKSFFPNVTVRGVEEYFLLAKGKREKYGVYLLPKSLPFDSLNVESDENGWEAFSRRIRKEYPVQGLLREAVFDYNNPIYAFFGIKKYQMQQNWCNFKRFFSPPYPRYHKIAPRWEYLGINTILITKNFALLQDFWHEEVVDGVVDWDATPDHTATYNWLKNAIKYIEEERPKLVLAHERAMDSASTVEGSYLEKYAEANKLELELHNKDTNLLVEIIKRRDELWT